MTKIMDQAVIELAENYVEKALANLRKHQIPPTPENLMVWYHYAQQDLPQLNRELEMVVQRGGNFSANICQQLYQRFFVEADRRQLDLLREVIGNMISKFSVGATELEDGLNVFEQVLSQTDSELSSSPDARALKKLIEVVFAASSDLREKGAASRDRMVKMKAEIGQLQTAFNELERHALEDPLTGVANRRAFDKIFKEHVESAKMSSSNFCLLLVDIDNFKQFNDRYGHLMGDKVLRFIALKMRDVIKGQDFLSRFGGEEFAIILPNTVYGGGVALASAILKKIASAPLIINDGEAIDPVTVSIGVADSLSGEECEALFRRADVALYKAKAQGRNRVIGCRDVI